MKLSQGMGRTLAAFTTMLAVLSMWLVTAGPAAATPEIIGDASNKTCGDFEGPGQDWVEFKIESPSNGTFGNGTIAVTISNYTDKTFDWSSNIGVDAVYVKAGAAGSYLYRYDPPAEETSHSGLTTPGSGDSNQISHISFCYDLDESTTTTSTEPTTTSTEPTTTTTEPTTTTHPTTTTTTHPTTTTTEPSTTTTTEPSTTTTTEPTTTTTTQPTTTTTQPSTTTTTEPTTTSTVGDEVLGVVITSTSSTVPDQVLAADVTPSTLPFTGFDTETLALLGVAVFALGLLILAAARTRHQD